MNTSAKTPSVGNFLIGAGAEPGPVLRYDFQTFLRFAFAGALCCSITHTGVVPLDVVKTRLQTDPEKYKGMIDGFRKISRDEGIMMLTKGAGPTFVGYFLQGAFKFGFNEYFKGKFSEYAGPQNAKTYRLPIWLGASACAEFIADLFLCPLEATRIRLVAQPDYAKGLVDGFGKIVKNEGFFKLYTGLPPLLLKQVPYTMAKFSVFEATSEFIYGTLASFGYEKKSLSTGSQLTVSLGGGIIAGVAAAVISQPADTVLSKINKEKSNESFLPLVIKIMRRLGLSGLFLGVGARCIMVGTITAGQFFIYDYFKLLMGVAPAQLAERARQQHQLKA